MQVTLNNNYVKKQNTISKKECVNISLWHWTNGHLNTLLDKRQKNHFVLSEHSTRSKTGNVNVWIQYKIKIATRKKFYEKCVPLFTLKNVLLITECYCYKHYAIYKYESRFLITGRMLTSIKVVLCHGTKTKMNSENSKIYFIFSIHDTE